MPLLRDAGMAVVSITSGLSAQWRAKRSRTCSRTRIVVIGSHGSAHRHQANCPAVAALCRSAGRLLLAYMAAAAPPSLGSPAEADGTVVIGAVHERLSFRGERWPYYLLALSDGQVFLARRQPALYDAAAQHLAVREIPPGSAVRVRYYETGGTRWMTAVQILGLAEDQSPFDPVIASEAG